MIGPKEGNMENKATKSESECIYSNGVTLLNKGFEKAVEVSKRSLDVAAEQNAEILASAKKALKASQLPGLFVFDLATTAIENAVSLQKSLLDLAVEQSNAVVAAVPQHNDAAAMKSNVSNLIQQSVDRAVAAQTLVLNFAAKQTKSISETVKQQPGVAGSPVESVTDSVQRGVDTVVAAQKEILSNATKTLKATSAKA
jgi:hypothetical protein